MSYKMLPYNLMVIKVDQQDIIGMLNYNVHIRNSF